MANPTTNYGFVLPTPTDLVTDLPADFEVALQGVDTQMKTNADAATQKATLTTKGDIYAATGTSTPARVAVGTNDFVLTADSTAATGVAWKQSSAGSLTLLSTTTLSGATTTISSINQTYTNLYFIVYGVNNLTGDGRMRIAPNGDTTATFSLNSLDDSTGLDARNGDYMYLNIQNARNSSAVNSRSGFINGYSSAVASKPYTIYGMFRNTSSQTTKYWSAGGIYIEAAITSLVFSNSAGNFSAGTVLLYGVK
jgi:hypothetical protein